MRKLLTGTVLLLLALTASAAETQRWTANNGQLIMEDIPRIPPSLAQTLNRYQNIRYARISGWSEDGNSIYIKTRFGPVSQLHRVDIPGGARIQLTFEDEPVGEVVQQPKGELLALTLDRDGDEFDQILLLNPKNGLISSLTDGHALNNRVIWDRQGRRIAYRSTRRNGRSNDIWIQGIGPSDTATLVHKANDGSLWKPVDFSQDGKYLLIQQFTSVVDSRIWLKKLPDGEARLLVGNAETPASNIATGFDRKDANVLFVTNQRDGAAELARVSLGAEPVITFIPSVGNWDITQFALSRDRRRGAFITNENGISRLHLFDPEQLKYKRVNKIPLGLISGLTFSPDGKKLGMTLNSARSPNDAWVLSLGYKPLSVKNLTRWTSSEVGGLDTRKFTKPILIKYPSRFAEQDRFLSIPAFVYLPPGDGPFPVIIHIHGGPESQFRPSFNSDFQLWIDQLGVAVIAPNVRGSLGYGSGYIALDDGYKREEAVKDIGALLDWIALQSKFDKTRVAVFGASYGGYMALASAVHYGDRLRAAVDRFGISNFVTFLENTQDYRQALRRIEYGDERNPEMRAFLERISPMNNLEKINIPLLVVQGRNDPIVPMSESDQLVKALRLRGQTVWYMKALNEGHGYERKENRDLYQQATILFLQKYLLGEG